MGRNVLLLNSKDSSSIKGYKKGVPYWPQRNGEVERFNATMMKVIRIAEVERKPWKEELQKFCSNTGRLIIQSRECLQRRC